MYKADDQKGEEEEEEEENDANGIEDGFFRMQDMENFLDEAEKDEWDSVDEEEGEQRSYSVNDDDMEEEEEEEDDEGEEIFGGTKSPNKLFKRREWQSFQMLVLTSFSPYLAGKTDNGEPKRYEDFFDPISRPSNKYGSDRIEELESRLTSKKPWQMTGMASPPPPIDNGRSSMHCVTWDAV